MIVARCRCGARHLIDDKEVSSSHRRHYQTGAMTYYKDCSICEKLPTEDEIWGEEDDEEVEV